jgi:hypothetical protein
MVRILAILMALSIAVFAQPDRPVPRRATMTGSRGENGKCTVEVNVDGTAEIEIQADRGEMYTLAGQPASWVRFECSEPMPRQPQQFKFKGIDGRGRQLLLRDPNANRGVAVIRIEDPKGGREGYTFDVEWRGIGPSIQDNLREGLSPFGRDPGNDTRILGLCQDAVRDRVARDYQYRNIDFTRVTVDETRGKGDWVTGRLVYRRGRSQEEFDFDCHVDLKSGRIRSLELRHW